MLFNSNEFLWGFLPIVCAGFFALGRFGQLRAAMAWLVLASLVFYGWWQPVYVLLIAASMMVNFVCGRQLTQQPSQVLLAVGITFNLGLLGYFKYANFLVDNINLLAGSDYHLTQIILPLAISFFTFQQIAYLVDAHRGLTKTTGWLDYALFVTFFPQLIAGPIVHHAQMLPQFARRETFTPSAHNIAIGLTIFMFGLFKKVGLADNLAVYATPVFSAAQQGVQLSFVEAWGGVLAYTFQLYFDFSGYSDMAIGLARLFGIKLPINFNSPYKASSIIEFWRRWHMTLSQFLRDYLYIPLGGNQQGTARRNINLLITMLLGGLWHGAGWNFLLWGGLHGGFLLVNHAWRRWFSPSWFKPLAYVLTFLAVSIAWVPFRAESWPATMTLLHSMAGLQGMWLPAAYTHPWLVDIGVQFGSLPYFAGAAQILWLLAAAGIVWVLPNSQQWLQQHWRPAAPHAVITAAIAAAAIALIYLGQPSEFLYFQF